MQISVIVRFRNEQDYLGAVLEALVQQDFPRHDYEIIAVDNCSTDNSRHIAERYTENIISISDYQPGKALNRAIIAAKGTFIAVISAHAIPSSRDWLRRMYSNMGNEFVAGAYGAQLYPVNSVFLDKRDLDIFSCLESRIEKKDSDFWNANSIFRRSLWERQRFDETVFELEDHYWTKQVLPWGYQVRFEPSALVYHYGHIDRLDREYLDASPLSPDARISNAIKELEAGVDWPGVMKAGLTLSSLTGHSYIKESVYALGKTLRNHPDFDVRWRMAQALGKIHEEASVNYLIEALYDPSFYPRDEAAWSLARIGSIAAEILQGRLTEFPIDVIPFAALALGNSKVRWAEQQAVDLLIPEIESGDIPRQRNAVYFAGEVVNAYTSERLIAPITSLSLVENAQLLAVCCWALGCFAHKAHRLIDWARIKFLAKHHPNLLVRFEATVALGKLALVEPYPYTIECLMGGLLDKEERVRYGAMQSLRRLAETGWQYEQHEILREWNDNDFGVMFEFNMIKKLANESIDSRKRLC